MLVSNKSKGKTDLPAFFAFGKNKLFVLKILEERLKKPFTRKEK